MKKPVRDFILCKIKVDDSGLIVYEDMTSSEQEGEVVESGPGRFEYGAFIPNEFKPGDRVYWSKYAERDFMFEEGGVKYTIIRAAQVIATEGK